MTEAELKRIRDVRWIIKGHGPPDGKVTREDVALLIARIDDLDTEDLHTAGDIVGFMLRRLQEDLTSSRAYLADQIEMTRIAELQVREAEHAVAAVKHLADGALFLSGDEINARWNAIEALYRAQGMLPEDAPAEAMLAPEPEPPEGPTEPESEPARAEPEPRGPEPDQPARAPWGANTRSREPVDPAQQEEALFASLKVAAGDASEIQVSLKVLAEHSGIPYGSALAVARRLAVANRIEIIPAPNKTGAKPPNTYRFITHEPLKAEEPAPAPIPDAPTAFPAQVMAPPTIAKRGPRTPDETPLRDRILRSLQKGACTTSGLASMIDMKELAVCQTLAAMEHEGTVKADEMPEAGRRAQLWRIAALPNGAMQA